jgi:uncharacterized phage protein (TIGR01671 family)
MKKEFIAYNKRNKRFMSSKDIAVKGNGDVLLCEQGIGDYGEMTSEFNGIYDDHIEILEYSGKKDRNGTKLYKGDIVKAELPMYEDSYERKEDLKPKTVIGIVVIRPSEGARILVKKVIPEGVAGIRKGRTLRIKQDTDVRIGHIYTNPELVAEDNEGKEEK